VFMAASMNKIPVKGHIILTGLFFGLIPYWVPLLTGRVILWGVGFAASKILGLSGQYHKNQLISLDQHGSALLGFDPDIVLSAVIHIYDFWLFNLLRPVLNRIEFEHTKKALAAEINISKDNLFFKAIT